jgi:chromosome segregation ATPase
MSRDSTVTFEKVEEAIIKVLQDGDNVTFPKVYIKMGKTGAADKVKEQIAEWSRRCVARFDKADVVEGVDDPRLVAVIRDGVLAAQRVAEDIVTERFASKELALDEEHARLLIEKENARAAVRVAESMMDYLEAELSVARAEIAGRDARLADMQNTLAAETAQKTALEARVAELGQKLEDQSRRHEETLADIEKRHTGQISTLQADLAAERERAAGERQHLVEQTDRLRQDKEKEIIDLRRQLKTAIDDTKRIAQEKDGDITRLRAQEEAGRKDLTEALSAIKRGQAEASTLHSRNEQLAGELEKARRALSGAEQAVASAQAKQESADEFRRAETARADRAEADLRSHVNLAPSPDAKKPKDKS